MPRKTRISYARARLILGMCNVGFWVMLASACLIGHFYEIFSAKPEIDRSTLISLASFLIGYVALQLPFDWIGGYFLPKFYGRFLGDFSDYIPRWFRGAVVQTAVLFAVALSTLLLSQWLMLLAAGWVIILLVFQTHLARWIADLRIRGKDRLKSLDEDFTGGIVGLPGFQKIILPNEPDMRLRSITKKRRHFLQLRYLPASGLIAAIAFHLVGIILVNLLINDPISTVRGLVESACWFTLWSFLGLLALPSVSRPAVYAGDYGLFMQGLSEEDFRHYITANPALVEEGPRRAWVEAIFYPVPSAQNRLARWGQPPGWLGGWHAARYAVYLSWGGLSFLGRAVHCNIGKPDVWVLLPCD